MLRVARITAHDIYQLFHLTGEKKYCEIRDSRCGEEARPWEPNSPIPTQANPLSVQLYLLHAILDQKEDNRITDKALPTQRDPIIDLRSTRMEPRSSRFYNHGAFDPFQIQST